MRAPLIDEIRQGFKNEWLLIRVIDFDRTKTLPVTGKVVAHSKDLQELYPVGRKYKKDLILFMHSDERLPKGYGYLL